MSGTLLSHFLPFRFNSVLFGLYDSLLPVMLCCAWASLALLDLARSDGSERGRGGWAAAIIALPVLGAGAYLLSGRCGLARGVRYTLVLGGVMVVGLAYGYTLIRIA
jgi:hypothetical protein